MPADLHARSIVIDGLIISDFGRPVFEDMRRGGLSAANCTCCVWEGFTETMRNGDALEGMVPRARRHHRAGLHHRRHPRGQGVRPDRDHPRLAERDRDRGPDRLSRPVQGTRRGHRPDGLQHPEPRRHRLLREPGRRPVGLRPRGRGRDEPARRAGRPLARRPEDQRGRDPGLETARGLLALPTGGTEGAPAQQVGRAAPLHRRAGRVRRRDHVPALPQARAGLHGGRLRRGDRVRPEPVRRGQGRHRHRLHARLRPAVLRLDHPRQGLRPPPDRLRRGHQPGGPTHHRRVAEPHCRDGAARLARGAHRAGDRRQLARAPARRVGA